MRDRPPPERGAFLETLQGSCSIPGSTTWWSRPFYCEKIRSNPQPPWSIWWFFSENRTFWRVFKLCFSSYFQNLLKFAIFVEFGLIMLIFTNIFWIFEGSKHAILSKNHRQGSRTWWSRQFYWDKIQSNPRSLWYIWWFFRENLTFWGIFKVQFVLPSSIFVSFTSHRSRRCALSFLFYLFLSMFRKLGPRSGFTRSCGFSSVLFGKSAKAQTDRFR